LLSTVSCRLYTTIMSNVKKIIRKVIPAAKLRQAENFYRLRKAQTANVINRRPAKGMNVIAVTGTNGKTTTCAFVNAILKAGGHKTAVYTTAFTEINGVNEPNKSHMTVVSAWSVQNFLKKAKTANVDWVILEVTSHALDQFRLYGVPVKIAAVTNLTQDHLDYHGTMENYAAAKARLITDFKPQTVILNADDEWYSYFAKQVNGGLKTIGQNNATHQIKELQVTPKGTTFRLVSADGDIKIATKLIGDFNAYNVAMAAVVGQAVGVKPEQIIKGVADIDIVPGRLEPINCGQPFAVLVDYAITPDAIKRTLATLKSLTGGKLTIVFGSTGDRDKGKRPLMGEVAANLADKIYLTDDETYTEDGETIRAAVRGGIQKAGGQNKYVEIADRYEAIKMAFNEAKAGDVVLLAGMGHQDYRNMGGKKMPWDEREVARELLNRR
jgi:UDP-N-acetylmuramoyl-L-alanyl-D-glutamate--2,6-diaminopimelate ligase